jgi:valyl-tRNA synthetase
VSYDEAATSCREYMNIIQDMQVVKQLFHGQQIPVAVKPVNMRGG